MQCTVNRQDLAAAIGMVGPAVPTKTQIESLRHILLTVPRKGKTMRVRGTDLTVDVDAVVPCQAKKAGSVAIVGRAFRSFLGGLPKDAHVLNLSSTMVDMQGEKPVPGVKIEVGDMTTVLAGIKPSDFPPDAPDSDGAEVKVDARAFAKLLADVEPAIATEASRPVLCSIKFEVDPEDGKLTLRAADGFRLAIGAMAARADKKAEGMVPDAGIPHLIRMAKQAPADSDLTMRFTNKPQMGNAVFTATIEAPQVTLKANQVVGTFPDTSRLIPEKWNSKAVVDAEAMLTKVKALPFLTMDKGIIRIQFDRENQRVKMTLNHDDGGHSETSMDAQVDHSGALGQNDRIALNRPYLLDALSAMTGQVAFEMEQSEKPAHFHDGRMSYVVMPMFVQ